MGRLSLDVALFYGSLGISLAAVALFLWLMRPAADAEAGDPRLRGGTHRRILFADFTDGS